MVTYFNIAKVNLKINLYPHILLAVLICIAAPWIMGVENLNKYQTAQVLELYVSLIGMVLCVPLFIPDQNTDIRELLQSKKEPMYIVQMIRLFMSLIITTAIMAVFLLYLKKGNCEFDYGEYLFAGMANCLFLGGLGTIAYSIIDNIAVAYMIPILYYVLCFGAGDKYLGKFYLFSLTRGSFSEKYYLFGAGIMILGISIIYRNLNCKLRCNPSDLHL